MLIFTNIEGKKEAVAKNMVVRFSVKHDLVFNKYSEITLIHLTTKETLRCLDNMDTLIKQMKARRMRKAK